MSTALGVRFGRVFPAEAARFHGSCTNFQAKHDRPFALHAARYRRRARSRCWRLSPVRTITATVPSQSAEYYAWARLRANGPRSQASTCRCPRSRTITRFRCRFSAITWRTRARVTGCRRHASLTMWSGSVKKERSGDSTLPPAIAVPRPSRLLTVRNAVRATTWGSRVVEPDQDLGPGGHRLPHVLALPLDRPRGLFEEGQHVLPPRGPDRPTRRVVKDSNSTNGSPIRPQSIRASVDLPAPGAPATAMRRTGSTGSGSRGPRTLIARAGWRTPPDHKITRTCPPTRFPAVECRHA